jgi:hypothetical protein
VLSRIQTIAAGFGLDAQTVAAARREKAEPAEVRAVIERLVDPLWSSVCRAPGFERYFVKFDDGELIAGHGVPVHHTFLLLEGAVRVEQGGRALDVESKAGTFLCAISTLTGAAREVTLRAQGTVWCCIFNEAGSSSSTCNPAVAVACCACSRAA